jgi:cell volume regulation protein A
VSIVYLVIPAILILVVLAAVFLDRWSVPVILVALGAGIAFGSDGLRLWDFGDMKLTNEVANFALVFILFNGGFGTKKEDFRLVALPAGGLATWGVLLTAAATFGVLHFCLGWALQKALLISVIISSTDAAATFSILRRQSLSKKLSSTVEIESAANDPMAILLTLIAVQTFATGDAKPGMVVLSFLWKFSAGPAIGWLLARGALWLYNRLSPQDRGYYYVLFIGTVLLTYGAAEAAQASGMLSVFMAGFVMGNRPFVHKQGVANFSQAVATIANLGMFVLLGLLVFPHEWKDIWVEGVVLFLVLALVARPAAVFIGTAGMGMKWKEKLFASWAGLRGAVPIVLATYPAAAGLAGGNEIFNLVFFAVLLSVSIQGSTLGLFAKLLGLSEPSRPAPLYSLELLTMAKSDLDLVVVDLPDPKGIPGPRVRDLKLPAGAVITLVTRGKEVVAPNGNTILRGWDQVTVLAHAQDEGAVQEALLRPFDVWEKPRKGK